MRREPESTEKLHLLRLLLPLGGFVGEELWPTSVKVRISIEDQRTSGLMNGTTPPCEMTTDPRSLFNLKKTVRNGRNAK